MTGMTIPITLRIVHLALSLSPVAFLVVGFFAGPKNMNDYTIPYAAAGVGVMAAAFGFAALRIFYKPRSTKFEENLPAYFTAKIIQWAMVEGAAMFNGVAFFLTGFEISAGACAALVLALLYLRPLAAEVQAAG